jgi:hypothetical protein
MVPVDRDRDSSPPSPPLWALGHVGPRAARRAALWPTVAPLRPDQPAGTGALPSLELWLDARSPRGRRRLPPEPASARVRHVPSPNRREGPRQPILPTR